MSSPAMTPVSPKICAMPSPTLITRPTSADTISASKSFRRCLITSLISFELMANLFSVPCPSILLRDGYTPAQLLQPRGHARVDHLVTDPEDQPADDRRLHARVEPDLAVEPS